VRAGLLAKVGFVGAGWKTFAGVETWKDSLIVSIAAFVSNLEAFLSLLPLSGREPM
jgi:hypothetical protein